MRPGVNDDAGEIQPLRALELVGEGVHGPAPGGVIRRAEIDQVARVGEDVADARLPARRVKGADLRVRHRPGVPLALVPQEELHSAAVERPSALEADGLAALTERPPVARLAPDVVARGEEVAGVDADPDPLGARRTRQ